MLREARHTPHKRASHAEVIGIKRDGPFQLVGMEWAKVIVVGMVCTNQSNEYSKHILHAIAHCISEDKVGGKFLNEKNKVLLI